MKIFALLLVLTLVAFATDQSLAERIDETSDVADENVLNKQDDEKLDSEDIMMKSIVLRITNNPSILII